MGARRTGRIIAFQSLYRFEFTGEGLESLLDFSWFGVDRLSKLEHEAIDFSTLLITGVMENLEEVDNAIKKQLEHWDFDRLARVDLAILRISVYCLLFQQGIPYSVTIDEAIDIAKEFGTDDSYRFVNGVLDAVRKHVESIKT
jgi:N utilization substance protein B